MSKSYEKIIKIMLWVLMLIGVVLAAWGYGAGFNDASVDTLLYWAYVLVIVGIAAALLVGIIISLINNPKSIVKMGIGLVAVIVVVGGVYLISSGAPAMGYNGPEVSAGTLKMTDTLLNLTYILFAVAIVAIIFGAVMNAFRK